MIIDIKNGCYSTVLNGVTLTASSEIEIQNLIHNHRYEHDIEYKTWYDIEVAKPLIIARYSTNEAPPVGMQSCCGSYGEFPRSNGNYFGVIIGNKSYPIINMWCENYEEAIIRFSPETYVFDIYNDKAAILICDEIPKEWFIEDLFIKYNCNLNDIEADKIRKSLNIVYPSNTEIPDKKSSGIVMVKLTGEHIEPIGTDGNIEYSSEEPEDLVHYFGEDVETLLVESIVRDMSEQIEDEILSEYPSMKYLEHLYKIMEFGVNPSDAVSIIYKLNGIDETIIDQTRSSIMADYEHKFLLSSKETWVPGQTEMVLDYLTNTMKVETSNLYINDIEPKQ